MANESMDSSIACLTIEWVWECRMLCDGLTSRKKSMAQVWSAPLEWEAVIQKKILCGSWLSRLNENMSNRCMHFESKV